MKAEIMRERAEADVSAGRAQKLGSGYRMVSPSGSTPEQELAAKRIGTQLSREWKAEFEEARRLENLAQEAARAALRREPPINWS